MEGKIELSAALIPHALIRATGGRLRQV